MPRRHNARLAVLLASVAISCLRAAPPQTTTYKVGITTRVLAAPQSYEWRGAADHVLNAIIWYPADRVSVEVPQDIGPPGAPLFNAGMAALDAAPARTLQGFPLIALSHGSGGSAQQMAWLGTYLAAHGYIVTAVDHPGNNSNAKYTVQGFTLWWERAHDISTLIDGMIADSVFRERIDKTRIGAAGFSLGGYTMMILAGAVSDPALLQSFCTGPARDALCNDQPEFPGLKAQSTKLAAEDPEYHAALTRANQSYRDHAHSRRLRNRSRPRPGLLPASARRNSDSGRDCRRRRGRHPPHRDQCRIFRASHPRLKTHHSARRRFPLRLPRYLHGARPSNRPAILPGRLRRRSR